MKLEDYFLPSSKAQPILQTSKGALFQGDCLDIIAGLGSDKIDLIFADPPFNLGKDYGGDFNDLLDDDQYLDWCKDWIRGCSRVLKPGGAFFLYSLPKWNMALGSFMQDIDLTFRHWISIDIKFGPYKRPDALYSSHYSLLYFSKGGSPTTFNNIRIPFQTCRHCGKEIKDYGGHRKKMNPLGVSLTDVWSDITPVRHWKFKSKKRKANQLSTRLLWRVIQMASNPGDVVLDPFGGSGTTFDVAEHLDRQWLGIELETHHCKIIEERLRSGDLHHHPVTDNLDRKP